MGTGSVEFRQTPRGRVFSYLLYSLVKSHLNGWDILRLGWPCFQSQRLGLSEEIPRVVLDSPETDRGLCVLLVC